MRDKNMYPVTILKTRYGGVYEGGKWVAINEKCGSDIFEDILGDDLTCSNIFSQLNDEKTIKLNYYGEKIYIGVGNTPEKAYENLIN